MWGRALLALASFCVALLLCEVMVRVAGLGDATLSRGSLHDYEPDVGWTCARDLDARYVLPGNFDARIVCNHRGQRSPELPLAKAPGRLRIAVLGDSFMWGYGVENDDMLPNRLTRLLPDSEVVNLAANGYSNVQELVRFEKEGVPYAPDWTLLAFTWNDLGDNFDDKNGGRPVAAVRSDGVFEILNRPVRRPWKSHGSQRLRRASRLLVFLDYEREWLRLQLRDWRHRHETGPRIDPDDADPLEFSGRELYGPPGAEIDFAWQTVGSVLARVDALARGAGGRLLVIANASADIMRPEGFTRRYGDDPNLDWDRPGRRLGAICKELGIQYVDLNPVFRREPEPRSLFFPSNGHWSPAGHELAAQTVAARLRELVATRG